MREAAAMIAERLAAARGPVRVVAPQGGFSLSGVPGEPLWDEEANAAFLDALAAALPPAVPLEMVDDGVNAPAFADRVAVQALELFRPLVAT
jgi:uncharacterized protein (UPF0261 family)